MLFVSLFGTINLVKIYQMDRRQNVGDGMDLHHEDIGRSTGEDYYSYEYETISKAKKKLQPISKKMGIAEKSRAKQGVPIYLDLSSLEMVQE